MSFNQSGTFVYTPDIACSIYTENGIVDVSQDIIDFTIARQMNSTSQLNMTLANPGRKYNRKINTMDRVTVFLKRTTWLQVFTGYITYAPIETLVPTPVNIAADCTMRVLQNTYWDDTLMQFQQLLLNQFDTTAASSDRTVNDGGVAQALVNLLCEVTGWDPSRIHIQGIPQKLLEFAAATYVANTSGNNPYLNQQVIQQVSTIVGAKSIINGSSHSTGSLNGTTTQTVTLSGQPPGTVFTANYAQAFYTSPLGSQTHPNTPGSNGMNAVTFDRISDDIYWCGVPYVYSTYGKDQSDDIDKSKQWLAFNYWTNDYKGRPIVLINGDTGRTIVVRATNLIQVPNTTRNGSAVNNTDIANIDYIQVHPGVLAYLNKEVDDPTKFNVSTATHPKRSKVYIQWGGKNSATPGPQTQAEAVAQSFASSISDATTNTAGTILTATRAVVNAALAQKGARYSQQVREKPNNGLATGSFDCSGLTQWAYKQINVNIGTTTYTQWGTGSHKDDSTHGTFIPSNQRPQLGDLLFWDVPTETRPGHVTLLSQNFGTNGKGKMMGAVGSGTKNGKYYNIAAREDDLNWNDIKGGKEMPGWGMTYMGARRPITLHHSWGISSSQTASIRDTTTSGNPNSADNYVLNMTTNFNMLYNPPQFDVRASALVGSPRAFLLDNNVMTDFKQIIGAGLRVFMSAPNGDFVAWFPDYYGIYSTDPTLDISPVEIIDFQIYHDDNQLVTHYGVIGDTNGIGQQVSFADYLSTNGIVSIQDNSTMQILFGSLTNGKSQSLASLEFLNRYGMRPMTQEQNMIHSHAMEYIYALTGFMQQWSNQYASTISLTFMPELYPGMRVSMSLDNESGGTDRYEFYCTAVTHQGSRTAGFTTQAVFTAPVKNGALLDYGLGLV